MQEITHHILSNKYHENLGIFPALRLLDDLTLDFTHDDFIFLTYFEKKTMKIIQNPEKITQTLSESHVYYSKN